MKYILIILISLLPSISYAGEAKDLAEDPVLEQRMVHLAQNLRCLVCQNESLASSRADLAKDLRQEVREKMKQGMTDQQIIDFLVSKYGDFVLFDPPMKRYTILLWYGPFALLLIGLAGLVYQLRKRKNAVPEVQLSAEEAQRAAALLNEPKDPQDMMLFWILCAALSLVAVLFIALPLWRKSSSPDEVLRDAANLEILRDQAAELEVDLHNGLLTEEAYNQGMTELESRLLEEVKITEQPAAKPPRNPAKVLAIALAVLLPVVSVSLYWTLGNPDALSPQDMIVADAEGVVHSPEALAKAGKEGAAGFQRPE